MSDGYLIGLDFGTESARGVLIEAASGRVLESCIHPYPHAVLTEKLPGGESLPSGWALQCASDYTEVAAKILRSLGQNRRVLSIGLGFTASSPLPCLADGTPLSDIFPQEAHAYVKLWKHQSAQAWADQINAVGGDFLAPCGGRLSGEWLLAKAAQMAEQAPDLWQASARFIEAGDWLVWQLCGQEVRSLSFAAYKAQYRAGLGYPDVPIVGLAEKLRPPAPLGTAAGALTPAWLEKTGIQGAPLVAVAVIDSHVALPALGVVDAGSLVGALGTSAVFLLLDRHAHALPAGIEGMAYNAALPDLWCYEAGQASFGDVLAWFVRAFPCGNSAESFAHYNQAASALRPGQNRLLALDWWNGCRVPLGDALLSGALVGLSMRSTAVDIYRALLDALCFGARTIVDLLADGGILIDRVVLTGGLTQKNDFLLQLLADILGRELEVPRLEHPTAVGAAIHGAVAAGVAADYADAARRFGARDFRNFLPDAALFPVYDVLYRRYRRLTENPALHRVMHEL